MFGSVLFKSDVVVCVEINFGAFNHVGEVSVFYGAYAARHRTVLGHGVGNAESNHAIISLAVAGTGKFFGDYAEGIGAVIVVGVDYGERFVDYVGAHQYGMVGAPGLYAVGMYAITLGQLVKPLENDFNRNVAFIFREDFLAEIFLKVLADDKHDLAESGAEGVVD